MAFRLLDKVTAIGASRSIKLPLDIGVKEHTVHVAYSPNDVTAVSALEVKLQGSYKDTDAHTGVVTQAGIAAATSGGNSGKYIAIGSTFTFLINDTNYTVAAATAGQAFSAAHVVGAGAGNVYGVVNVYIDSSGVIHTLVPGLSQTAAQIYASAALAQAATIDWVKGVDYPLTWCHIGRLIIKANAAWTANASDLTAGSGLVSIQFISIGSTFKDIMTYSFSADDLTGMGAMFTYKGSNPKWVRLFLSTLTGNAQVTARYMPEDSP